MIAQFSVEALAWLALAIVAAGVVSGVLAGLFGVGGGAVIVPVLYEIFGLLGVPEEVRMHLCIGTSLAIIIPTSIRSFRAHRARGAVDMDALKIWAIPVVLGVVVGSLVAGFVPSAFLKGVFMTVGALIALKMLSGSTLRFSDDLPGKPAMTAYGLGIGLLSSWMGIGGGSFGNLIYAMHNRPVHQGVATSSGLGVLIAIPGAIGYVIAGWPEMAQLPPASLGYVSLIGAIIMAPVSVLVAPLGVKLAHGWSKRRLEIALGSFLLLVSLRFAYDLLA
ncbi:UPF0721 transmembrane protein [Agaricicola taiwanensis]|uniref:Probable membrane transporter protein n=1 Tax=Agaricicola taiwanensis TaxID=591372 RepID=A0A8J2YCL1_9RHOB|nr:sulfite exporter TauE/SafE family protein [Agaricicola taiwanensis]GGE37247.1 UPF0721 transmembrane protein [Agaricicola taiwanensis]